MKRKTTYKENGAVLILVVVFSFVFLAMAIVVGKYCTSAITTARFSQQRQTALTMAETGVNYLLYKFNYADYSTSVYATAGATSNYLVDSQPFSGQPGSYQLDFNSTEAANSDYITVRGYSKANYEGRIRTLRVNIRGTNTAAGNLNAATQGIAEAFNKHVIYARNVNISDGSITIRGNILYTDDAAGTNQFTSATGSFTSTQLDHTTSDFGIPSINLSAVYSVTQHLSPSAPGGYTWTYTDPTGGLGPYDCPASGGGPAGTYTDANTCVFSSGTFDSDTIVQDGNTVVLSGTNVTAFFKATGNITNSGNVSGTGVIFADGGDVIINGTPTIDGSIQATGDITINGGTITGNISADGTITINGGTITDSTLGDSVIDSDTVFIHGGTVTGDILASGAGGDVTVDGGTITGNLDAGGQISIDTAGAATRITGNVLAGGVLTITGDGDMSNDDITGTVASQSSVILQANSVRITPTSPDQPAIVVYNTGAVNENITLAGSGATEHQINGLIFAGDAINIQNTCDGYTLGSGPLVAGGQVTISVASSGTITYNPDRFKNNTPLYANFSGGRRTYLPAKDASDRYWQEVP